MWIQIKDHNTGHDPQLREIVKLLNREWQVQVCHTWRELEIFVLIFSQHRSDYGYKSPHARRTSARFGAMAALWYYWGSLTPFLTVVVFVCLDSNPVMYHQKKKKKHKYNLFHTFKIWLKYSNGNGIFLLF